LPSFPHCALKNQQAQQVRAAESCLFQLRLPGLDISRIECVDSRCRESENQSPNPLHGAAGPFLKLRQPRRQGLVFFQHRARQQPRFALQRTQQRAARVAFLRVRGNFQPARAIHLPLDVQQERHFVQMLHLVFWQFAHEAPPAASAALPSSACRSS
jgi:hypothetical protein